MIWRTLARIAGKAIEKAKGVDPSDVMAQSTGSDILDLLRDLIW